MPPPPIRRRQPLRSPVRRLGGRRLGGRRLGGRRLTGQRCATWRDSLPSSLTRRRTTPCRRRSRTWISRPTRASGSIRKSLWLGQGRKFTAQFFHRGYIYQDRVDIYEVADGKAEPIRYSPTCSVSTRCRPAPAISASPVSASTTRSTARTTQTKSAPFWAPAISARSPKARDTAFRPAACRSRRRDPRARNFRLSGPSGSNGRRRAPTSSSSTRCSTAPAPPAAFRFTIRPGDDTIFDTETAIYPRTDIAQAGHRAADQHVPVRRQRPRALR